jgi:hypothetical protein
MAAPPAVPGLKVADSLPKLTSVVKLPVATALSWNLIGKTPTMRFTQTDIVYGSVAVTGTLFCCTPPFPYLIYGPTVIRAMD